MTHIPIITAIELGIVDRLTRGLGRMVSEVKTYGGEFDDDELDEVVRRFPAAWVTFGGVKRTDPHGTSKGKWKAEAVFVVMVGARSVRSEEASRHGGASQVEVGTNLLIASVRKLLTMQDLGLPIRELEPGSVRTLFNTQVRREAMSVFALEFRTAWMEESLFLGAYPQGAVEDPNGLGAVFEQYGGKLDPPTPDWKTTVLKYYLQPKDSGTQGEPDAEDRV
ncbi:DUF1834 family protein [Pandoraea nosoerga]|uniref:Mu-like prophage protein gp37 n=2 Tax=Pandoraea TaxID=93217 RepID=A0A5E4T9B4_9BURK|nr:MULTISPECIES: DUF1834 family protein [Pandoraea]MBN4664217.1 DUF1834 family protein [Pandoraea nosoerga]MBN4675374.1 DUF1834 family protein [Pandoraea nosoerga]MBN4679304.1 DUF1834 family protein [Pandoraea nosoerga]MBN4743698.1 DUF1834 family protein [Pandoraea nosoerga]VVD84071.1 hypothetical protein PNO31109_01256 [Pandoraea nosoerga]